MSVHKGKHKIGHIPETLMQVLIAHRRKGNEDWMTPERARYEIVYRDMQKRMKGYNAMRRHLAPTVEKDGFEAVWTYTLRESYPDDIRLPERPDHYKSRYDMYVSNRYMTLLLENLHEPDAFSRAFSQAHSEAKELGLEHHNW